MPFPFGEQQYQASNKYPQIILMSQICNLTTLSAMKNILALTIVHEKTRYTVITNEGGKSGMPKSS